MSCPKHILGDMHLSCTQLGMVCSTNEERLQITAIETELYKMQRILEKRYDIQACRVKWPEQI